MSVSTGPVPEQAQSVALSPRGVFRRVLEQRLPYYVHQSHVLLKVSWENRMCTCGWERRANRKSRELRRPDTEIWETSLFHKWRNGSPECTRPRGHQITVRLLKVLSAAWPKTYHCGLSGKSFNLLGFSFFINKVTFVTWYFAYLRVAVRIK